MKILLTNDDGINANGLKTLWMSLLNIPDIDIYIVAPKHEQSGKGVSVTFNGPLRTEAVSQFNSTPAWKVIGTPADCVKIGISGVTTSPPNLIVSGVNHGSNAGRGIFSSGTAGSIIQGVLQGIPGIAFSYACEQTRTFPHIKKYITSIVKYIIRNPLKPDRFLNVNFPSSLDVKGIKLAQQGRSFWLESLIKHQHSTSIFDFHLNSINSNFKEDPNSDIMLLKQGFITAVPIHIGQLTDTSHITETKEHFEQLF